MGEESRMAAGRRRGASSVFASRCVGCRPAHGVCLCSAASPRLPDCLDGSVGSATSNVFDGNKDLDGTTTLKGISRKCRLGMLTLFEWYK